MHDQLTARVRDYYSDKIRKHGPVPAGVDWNGEESQTIRFQQLAKLLPDGGEPFSIIDWGCGYGALFPFLKERNPAVAFTGFDISTEMIAAAREKYPDARWVDDLSETGEADFVVASGIFNVRLETASGDWQAYLLDTLRDMDGRARRGLAFNVLTAYSDADKMRDNLFYADPTWLFDFCKRNLSRRVALLHDYPLWEFTLIIRK